MKRRILREAVWVFGLVGALAVAACSSPSQNKNEYSGQQIVQGLMGVGPVAPKFGEPGTLTDRLNRTKEAIKNHSIPPEMLEQYKADMVGQSGDPLPAPKQPSRAPSETELEQLAAAMDQVSVPTEAQFEKLVSYVVAELDRRAPGYLDKFADDMQSGDAGRVANAMKVMQRSLVGVFESKELAARVKADPDISKLSPGSLSPRNEGGGSSGGSSGSSGGSSGSSGSSSSSSGFDPVVVPNQTPNSQNTVTYDQYAVGTRAAVGAYVGAVVVVAAAAVVWAAAVKGLGPFIPLANMHDQNPGDPLGGEMQIAGLTNALAKK